LGQFYATSILDAGKYAFFELTNVANSSSSLPGALLVTVSVCLSIKGKRVALKSFLKRGGLWLNLHRLMLPNWRWKKVVRGDWNLFHLNFMVANLLSSPFANS
jgi:hypothetical protein